MKGSYLINVVPEVKNICFLVGFDTSSLYNEGVASKSPLELNWTLGHFWLV